ncbi:hypothetical protein HCU01_33940 [Halomonas cupida]|nr:LolA-related protein [Halomonas cupida]GEN25445.1 hypothetical protein HCU01_33940 [Halomonas cupida]
MNKPLSTLLFISLMLLGITPGVALEAQSSENQVSETHASENRASETQAADDLDAERLATQLARQAPACVSFEQQRWIAELESEVTSSGYFHRLPEGLVWQTLKPIEDRVLLSADNPDLSTGMRALLPILSGLLEGDWSKLEQHFDIALEGSMDAWHTTLKPRDSMVAEHLDNIALEGGVRLDQMDIQFTSGDRLALVLEPVACSSLPKTATTQEDNE